MTEKDINYEITGDGTVIGVYDDDNLLQGLGDFEVVRVSDVEFDPHLQRWVVRFRNGVTLPETYERRIQALNAEIDYVQEHLTEFGAWVKDQLKAGQSLQYRPAYADPSLS
jgi:hypothetical protein